MNKDSGMRIRVEGGLRESFIEICRAQDKPAAQVLGEFMRSYVAAHQAPSPSAKMGPQVMGQKRQHG